ncbi:hypothetical protein [Cytobacillus sp. FSL R7-0696]|uniref:hypothetical protein n=1 Tax=Cytobacillus TaxID=2675230 RepID=UPI0030F704EF
MKARIILTSIVLILLLIIVWQYVAHATPPSIHSSKTKVADVVIKGLGEGEIKSKLLQKVEQWRNKAQIKVTYLDEEWILDPQLFRFNVEGTVKEITEGTNHPLFVEYDKQLFYERVEELFSQLTLNEEEMNKIYEDMVDKVSRLETSFNVQIEEYLPVTLVQEPLAQVVLQVDDDWSGYAQSVAIDKRSLFSVLDQFGEENDLPIIATGIYQLILHTNFSIEERYIQNKLPSFTEAGYEAYVDKKRQHDFKFYNPHTVNYTIKIEESRGRMYFTLLGPPFIYDYEAVIKETEQIEPLTKVYNQEGLEDGAKIIEEGAMGIRVVIERQKRKGMFIETFARLKDYYPPISTIEWRGDGREEEENKEVTKDSNEESEPRDDLWGIEGEKMEK